MFFFFAVWLICLRSKKLSGTVVLLALGGTFAVCMGLCDGLPERGLHIHGAGRWAGAVPHLYCRWRDEPCGLRRRAGRERRACRKVFRDNGVFRVDRLILTHLDADHCNGAAQLLSRIRVDVLTCRSRPFARTAQCQTIREAAREAGTQIKFVCEDMNLRRRMAALQFLHPDLRESGNNGGLCVLASHEKYDILITGDLSQNAEYRLLSRYDLQDVELLVAGHHGAATSTSDALLQRTGASSVVISVGRDNSYGHPAADTLARIQNTGAAIYRTDELEPSSSGEEPMAKEKQAAKWPIACGSLSRI